MGSRIAVVGVGAVGASIAADLSDLARHDLRLCTRGGGGPIAVLHADGETRLAGPFTRLDDPREAVDWVILATKAHQSASAKPWLDALCGAGTVVAVLQNGVDAVERIAPLVGGPGAVLPVVVHLAAERRDAGRTVQADSGGLVVPDDARGRAFARLFDGGRTAVEVVPDLAPRAWGKLLVNAAVGGVGALTLRENGVVRDPELRALTLGLMREVAQVARAEGADLPPDAPERALARVLETAPDHLASIAADRRDGRPMEWECRNAVVGRLARRHGIATPLNDLVTALLRVADEGRRGLA